MQSAPQITVRRSSKKRVPPSSEEQQQRRERLKKINEDIKKRRAKLSNRDSFDSPFWQKRACISKLLHDRVNLNRKISLGDMNVSKTAWVNTEEGKAFVEDMRAHQLDFKICARQADRLRLDAKNPARNKRRTFMKLFTTSHRGLGINIQKSGDGKRPSKLQWKLRKCLIGASNSHHPNVQDKRLWCAITGEYMPAACLKAAHIFPWASGQLLMTEIFGEGAGLNSIYNAILMSEEAETHFDKGNFLIVPNVDEQSSAAISLWHQSSPKSFKIRVVDPKSLGMDNFVNGEGTRTFRELDGKVVEFRGVRPWARFLYYHYCVTMLRRSWNKEKKGWVLANDLGKPFWATPGPYVSKNMLKALVEEMGHEYEALMAGAIEEQDDGQDKEVQGDIFLSAAVQTVQMSNGGKDEVSYQVEGSVEEEEEEEDEGWKVDVEESDSAEEKSDSDEGWWMVRCSWEQI
ncbi:MAG: hypothetical protein LQ339_003562 [Xanthoria mediterranea]|nr:MAG: hypothetical protein LQ339_003562 [Xanthoria mediterranea]